MTSVLHRGACLSAALSLFTSLAAASLESGFRHPPPSTKPWVYWYWISDNISREGITRDLEAMARVGIGEALIGNIFLEDVERGSVKALTEEWWSMVEHAIREGGRVGVNLGLFNCPGWSQSGGPWIKPEQAMRYLVSSERRVTGPVAFAERIPPPKQPFQTVAVLAFPAPRHDGERLAIPATRVACTPAVDQAERLLDGNRDTVCRFPAGSGLSPNTLTVELEPADAFTARSLVLHPGPTAFAAECALQVAERDGPFRLVRRFTLDRSNLEVNVGPMPHGAVAVAFPPTTGARFRLVFSAVRGTASLAELELSGAARLEQFVEKQLGKMHPTPQPRWETYLWPAQAEPEDPQLAIAPDQVVDLTQRLGSDGTVRWDVPAGDWVILHTGMTPTGTKNAPASPEGQGLEVDKMNRQAAAAHFEAFIGTLLARLPAKDRKALKHVVADSYEMGSQNWTDGFGELFRQRYGYDATPWLPVLTGRLVGGGLGLPANSTGDGPKRGTSGLSPAGLTDLDPAARREGGPSGADRAVGIAEQSDRFLWDLRRLVADRVAYDYVGGLRELCHRHGLKLWLENYGHWGFPAEFLQYGGQADHIGGEFWATGELGSIELRAASSASHIYGRPIVSAEAFTGGPALVSTPWSLKRRGDWAATEGINHFVLHVYIHQPDDRRPGINAWFGTEFNRHNTWFDAGRAWIDYLRRSHFLLQRGRHVADVAYFIGEDTPKMTGVCRPPLPAGYDFDYINAEVIEHRLRIKDGRFVLPDGKAYRLLVLPDRDTMRPEVLRRIRNLVAAGGVIWGPPPRRSPSLQNYPACDLAVQKLASELWGAVNGQSTGVARFGKGQVHWGSDLGTVLRALEVPPDFASPDPEKLLWTHRTQPGADIYFVSNQRDQAVSFAPVFRVRGRAPEFWQADLGAFTRAGAFETVPGGLRVPLELPARGSVFVVFREPIGKTPGVLEVAREGETLLTTAPSPTPQSVPVDPLAVTNSFTLAVWAKPAADLDLPAQTDAGVGLQHRRNDLVFPAHGESLAGRAGHACAGLSLGRNGVAVYEHSGKYFAPLLVHSAKLLDWTHVVLVYRDGQPTVYLNGLPAHRGLRSRFTVHPSPIGETADAPFKGEAGGIVQIPQALTDAEVGALANSSVPPVRELTALPAIALRRAGKAGLEADVSVAGTYRVRLTDDSQRWIEVPRLPDPLAVVGPWEVQFPGQMDVPRSVVFDELRSWTDQSDEAIRHFAGTARYSCTFTPPRVGQIAGRNARLILDLGRVESMAEVFCNGVNLGLLWKPPFTLDVTDWMKPGTNRLEVRVTNAWRNRLVGDRRFPEGFPGAGPLEFKPHLSVDPRFRPDDALVLAGLLGPVRLHPVARVPVQ